MDNFKKRYNSLHEVIRNLRFNYTKCCLEKARYYLKLEHDEKALRCAEEWLKSNVFKPDYNLNSYLTGIKGSIRKKKEIPSRKTIKDIELTIIDFLKTNKSQTYTVQSILKNLEGKITNSEIQEYFWKNIDGLLNSLTFNRNIQSTQRKGKTYYFF